MCLPNFSYFFSPSFLATEDWCSLPSSPEEPYIPGKSGEHSAPLVLNQIKHFVSHGKIQFSLTGREHLLVSRKFSVNVHTFTIIYFILCFISLRVSFILALKLHYKLPAAFVALLPNALFSGLICRWLLGSVTLCMKFEAQLPKTWNWLWIIYEYEVYIIMQLLVWISSLWSYEHYITLWTPHYTMNTTLLLTYSL